MSKKSYKRNQNRLYREIKRRMIAEQKFLWPVSIVKCERKIETLKVRNMVPEYMEQTKEYIESEIKSLFLANDVTQKYKANLIIKEGDPLLRGNLDDISIEKASQIVVMAREDMSDGDDDNSNVLKVSFISLMLFFSLF